MTWLKCASWHQGKFFNKTLKRENDDVSKVNVDLISERKELEKKIDERSL